MGFTLGNLKHGSNNSTQKSQVQPREEGGKKANFRSSCHRGRRCSTARIMGTDGRVERKYRRGNESFSFLTLHKNTRVL